MPLFDLPLEELRRYASAATVPPDFRVFWNRTIEEARAFPLEAVFEPVENYLAVVDTSPARRCTCR
jgi:cephalosporin-C deacetylase